LSTRATRSDPVEKSHGRLQPTYLPTTRPAAGYSIVHAATLEDAERLLEGCPIVDSCRIYETIAV